MSNDEADPDIEADLPEEVEEIEEEQQAEQAPLQVQVRPRAKNMAPIPAMDWSQADVGESFSLFKQTLLLSCEDEEIVDDAKIALKIKRGLGNEGLRRLNASGLSQADLSNPAIIWDYFEKQLKLQVNFRVYRLELMQYRQNSSESIDEFVTRCKTLALKCEFEDAELQERILELLIASTPFEAFQHELLKQPKGHSLTAALEEGRRYEAISAGHRQVKGLQTQATTDVHSVRHKNHVCQNCGLQHKPRSCPAFKDDCDACGKKGHWAKMCRKSKQEKSRNTRPRSNSRQRRRRKPKDKDVHAVDDTVDKSDTADTYSLEYYAVTVSNQCMDNIDACRESAYTKLTIEAPHLNGTHKLRLKIDTGAAGNTLPVRTYRQMYGNTPYKDILQPANHIKLVAYNGEAIKCVGTIMLKCQFQDSAPHEALFYVVDVPGPAVAGLPTCELLRLVTINCDEVKPATSNPINNVDDLKQSYPEQFDTIGDPPN